VFRERLITPGSKSWIKKLEETDLDQERMEQIQTIYEASHKSYGYRYFYKLESVHFEKRKIRVIIEE